MLPAGMTNAGKTWTITGGKAPDQRGILPRALTVLFDSLRAKAAAAAAAGSSSSAAAAGDAPLPAGFTVLVSYVQIYKEQPMDLLGPNTKASLQIKGQ
jgi:hypothetical protein